MTETFRLTLGQLNPIVGDLKGNAARALACWEEARAAKADLVALPEMFLTGYQTQDLVRRGAFLDEVEHWLNWLRAQTSQGPALAIGAPWRGEEGRLHNGYHIFKGGLVRARRMKYFLPNASVFDEVRLFSRGYMEGPFELEGLRIGTPICEDAWYPDVPEVLVETGAELLLVPNGSPYSRGKDEWRLNEMVTRVVETKLPLVYLNFVGGQDDQIFDGQSFVLNPGGELAVRLPAFEETTAHVDFIRTPEGWRAEPGEKAAAPDTLESDYHAMVLGLRDYMGKAGFKKVLLGMSGGIDSAIVAVIAADALGPENVRGVMLPSEYTSQASLDDAAAIAATTGMQLDTLPIAGPRAAVTEALDPFFAGLPADLTEENIQSRLRGLLLMAQSNKFGEMLLTTGNKSEVAVGYATIYGDMAGGYNPIKDLYKTRVFEICRWRNANHRPWMAAPAGEMIPPRVIDKPPSAELRDDQKDSDSLPPYDVLDDILERLLDREESIAEIIAAGHDPAVVKKVEHLIFISEYKRFQSAPGPRLSRRAFWLDRRYPIVNRWRDKSG